MYSLVYYGTKSVLVNIQTPLYIIKCFFAIQQNGRFSGAIQLETSQQDKHRYQKVSHQCYSSVFSRPAVISLYVCKRLSVVLHKRILYEAIVTSGMISV